MSAEAKIIALLLSLIGLGAAILGYGHYRETEGVRVTTATYEASLNKQKAEAATLLASETAKVHTAEQALQAFKDNQELKDADHEKTVAGLSARLLNLAGPAGRLRDPNAAGCGQGGGGAKGKVPATSGDRPADQADAGGLLSPELSRLLQSKDDKADAINNAYISCRADAYTVRSLPPPD